MWYQRVTRTSTTEQETASMIAKDTQLPAPRTRSRRSSDSEKLDDSPAQFRRVCLRYCDQYIGVQQKLDLSRLWSRGRLDLLGRLDAISQQPEFVKLQQIAASFDRQSF